MTQPIDYLIATLSQTTNDGSVVSADQSNNQTNGTLVASQNIQNQDANAPVSVPSQTTSSPISMHRHIRLTKLLSTSSVKRKQHKHTNCLFCPRFCFCRKQIEAHLKESELCQALYMRKGMIHTKEKKS